MQHKLIKSFFRNFLPSLDAFFEDAMEQTDQDQQCDEEYW